MKAKNAALAVIVFFVLSSCVESGSSHTVEVKNKSTALVKMHFISALSSIPDSVVVVADNGNYIVTRYVDTGGGDIPSPFGYVYDTCNVIFNDTLRIHYVRNDGNPRNILHIENFARNTEEKNRIYSIYDNYTLTPDDLANAEPF